MNPNPRPSLIWLTGLSGSGKSTLATRVEARLRAAGESVMVLDGDILRNGLNSDLDYSAAGRHENIRRTGEVARLFMGQGFTVIAALISPFRADRDAVRSRVPAGQFLEVYVDCPLSVCEARDTKGLYRKARAGALPEFTGIASPYEAPLEPELRVQTNVLTVPQSVQAIIERMQRTPRKESKNR